MSVIIDRYSDLPGQTLTNSVGRRRRVVQAEAHEGNQREDIQGAHPGMYAAMPTKVDCRHGEVGYGHARVFDHLRNPNEGDHRAVVVGIGRRVENLRALLGSSPDQSLQERRVLSRAEVRNRLQNGNHERQDSGARMARQAKRRKGFTGSP